MPSSTRVVLLSTCFDSNDPFLLLLSCPALMWPPMSASESDGILLALMGPQISTFHWASLRSWGLRCPSLIGPPSTHGASVSIFHWASLRLWGLRCPSLIGPPTPSSSTHGASNVHLSLGLFSLMVPQMSIFDWASLHSWGLKCPFLISTHGASDAHL